MNLNRHKSGSQKRKDRKKRRKEDEANKDVLFKFLEKKAKKEEEPKTASNSVLETGTQEIESEGDAFQSLPQPLHNQTTKTNNQEDQSQALLLQNWPSCSGSNIPEISSALPPEYQYQEKVEEKGKSTASDETREHDDNQTNLHMSSFNPKNPEEWPKKLSDADRQLIVKLGLLSETELNKMANNLSKDKEGHSFPKSLIYSNSLGGREKLPRDWLSASPTTHKLYCAPCRLFVSSTSDISHTSYLSTDEGFDPQKNIWHKLYRKLSQHERSLKHKQCYLQWRTFESVTQAGSGAIDHGIQKQLASERDIMMRLLKRFLDVTLFLGSRGLPFRGQSSKVGDIHNGNFLGCLELISHYDTLLEEHLRKVQKRQEEGKKMQAHYLSNRIQNEFINICGKHVLDTILYEINKSVHFSLIYDSTPDTSHCEQNVLIIRYVHKNEETRQWTVQERFIEFFDFCKKTGKEIAQEIRNRLEHHKLNLSECVGQGYDNASNMSGKFQGVQAHMTELNSALIYSPCAAHSLNLIGVHSAACCTEAITFFGCVNRLYNLFSGSPKRWKIITEKTGCSLHRESDTRWSSRKEAIRPIARHLQSVVDALDELIDNREETKLTNEARSEAVGLRDYFSSFKAILMASIWVKVLECFDHRNLLLQSRNLPIDRAAENIMELTTEMKMLRDNWASILSECKLVAGAMDISPAELKEERRKRAPGERKDSPLAVSPEDKFKVNVFNPILDMIISQLVLRFQSLNEIFNIFSPILNFEDLTTTEIHEKCSVLINRYPKVFTSSLSDEIVHLKAVFKSTFKECSESKLVSNKLLNKIYDYHLESVFPEVCLGLRIFCAFL